MGCSSSSQTSVVDPTRPSSKPEESNGASTTGVASENGKVAEDSETIPDQTPAEGSNAQTDGEPTGAATSPDSSTPNPPAEEESQPSAAPAAETPKEAPADGSVETPAEPSADAPADPPPDVPADVPADLSAETPPAETPAEVEPISSEAAAPEQEATATNSEPKTEEVPASGE